MTECGCERGARAELESRDLEHWQGPCGKAREYKGHQQPQKTY